MIKKLIWISGLLLLIQSAWAVSTLQSIKKGHDGNKCWAVLDFSENAVWMGVSQQSDNVLSLYFYGIAGQNDNVTVTLDQTGNRKIKVKQITNQPQMMRVDVFAPSNMPLAVLKKNKYVVINCNDKYFANGNLDIYSDVVFSAGKVKLVEHKPVKDKMNTYVHFDGSYDWVGFIRHDNQNVSLTIRNIQIKGIPLRYEYDDCDLSSIHFRTPLDKDNEIRAELEFEPNAGYSIVRKPKFILIENQLEEMMAYQPEEESTSSSPFDDTESKPVDELADLFESSDQNEKPEKPEAVFKKTAQSNTVKNTNSLVQKRVVQKRPVPEKETTFEIRKSKDLIPWSRPVSFQFRETPIKNALRLLASSNDLNMVIDAAVEGTITMNLDQVTLREALEKIIYPHNCEYIVEGNIITVKPVRVAYAGGRVTKVYRLRYADAKNVAHVIRRVVSSDSLVEVFYPEFLEYEESAKGRREKNEVAVQGIRRSNILVVTDRPEKIREVDRVIAELDQAPVQILIESKLLETSPQNTSELGINWDKTITAVLSQQDVLSGGQTNAYSVLNKTPEYGNRFQMGHLSASEFSAVLDFLDEKTDAKLMSNPRLLAMDNEESSISVGTTVPVPRIQRGMGGQGDMVTFEYKEVNIQLNVTPHVADMNMITMYVNPVIEEIVGWVELQGNRAPITDKRTVNSIVTVKNGETVVIGGLIKTQNEVITSKVWLLGYIPLIGKLFQHQETKEIQKDLMIFITPTISEYY